MAEHIHEFAKTLELSEEAVQEPTVRLAVFRGPRGRVILCSPEVGLAQVERLGADAWIAFRRWFLHLLLDGRRPHYIMHASCVADDEGRAALVVGPCNSGKTSLLIALLQRGYKLACDDYAILDAREHAMLALPLGVTLTTSSSDMFPEIQSLKREECKFRCERQWQWTVNLADVYSSVPAFARLKPTHFFFVEADFGAQARIDECSREEALWRVQMARLESPGGIPVLNDCSPEYQERCFCLAQALVGRARFYKLRNGDVQQAADLVAVAFSE